MIAPATTRLLTADELAARWQIKRSQIYRLARAGQLPAVRIGKYYRFSIAAIEEFETQGGTDAD